MAKDWEPYTVSMSTSIDIWHGACFLFSEVTYVNLNSIKKPEYGKIKGKRVTDFHVDIVFSLITSIEPPIF